jgi:hypothetical protein
MESLRTLHLKNANISAQGVRILDLKPVLEVLINSTKNLRTRKLDLTARYLSKKALKLTNAEKTQTFENFVRGRSRQDLTETCLGHLGPSLKHPRSWFSFTIFFDPRWLQENREGFQKIFRIFSGFLGFLGFCMIFQIFGIFI